jgi:hypothetical protein
MGHRERSETGETRIVIRGRRSEDRGQIIPDSGFVISKFDICTLCALRFALCDRRGDLDENTEDRSPGHRS